MNRVSQIDIPNTDMSMVNFTSGLLEFIMMSAGHTDIKSGKIGEKYYIYVGKYLKFEDTSYQDVFRKMLFWLVTSSFKMTPEEYAEEAGKVLEKERKESEELIEKLSEGGMTEFGKKVQSYRKERGAKIAQALKSMKAENGSLPNDFISLHYELSRKTSYEDLDMEEVIVALGDFTRMESLFGS